MSGAGWATCLAALAVAVAVAGGDNTAAPPGADPAEYHRYLIVGAGPGGLQLGHYLDTAERDYVILDKVRGPRLGMQFARHVPRPAASRRRPACDGVPLMRCPP
jgi:hypothetical protein